MLEVNEKFEHFLLNSIVQQTGHSTRSLLKKNFFGCSSLPLSRWGVKVKPNEIEISDHECELENASDQLGNPGSVIGFVSDWRRLMVEPAIQIDQ